MIALLLPAWLRRAMAWAVALIVTIFGAWSVGRREGTQAAKKRAAEQAAADYRETTERINEADIGTGDHDDDVEWLRKRGKR